MTRYPDPPWRLRGRVLLVPALPAGAGGILVARYDERSTLAYSELLVATGVVRVGRMVGWRISQAYVDDRGSVAGGREVWRLPKELASFGWDARGFGAEIAQGERTLLSIQATRARLRWAQPVVAPFFGWTEGEGAFTVARGLILGGPVRVRMRTPEESGLWARRGRPLGVGFAGACRMVVPSPRQLREAGDLAAKS
jgi:hypothetical protein